MTISLSFHALRLHTRIVLLMAGLVPAVLPPAGAQETFLFPGRPADLPKDAFWVIREYDEGENIYDMNVVQFTGSRWSDCVDGSAGSCGTADKDLMWKLPIYSPVDGEIASCWRNFPDNPSPPSKRNDIVGESPTEGPRIFSGGNGLNIITDEGNVVSLAHFASGSIPPELCPRNPGSTTFPASVLQTGALLGKQEGWYPEGYIPAGSRPRVRKGDYLGGAGNSGRSSGVHLHLQVNSLKSAPDPWGREDWGPSFPMRFERVYVQELKQDADANPARWHFSGTPITASGTGPVLLRPAGWAADDIVWQDSSRQLHYWVMEAGARAAGADIGEPVSAQWEAVGVGNVDGRHHDDLVFRGGNGQMHYWEMKSGKRIGGGNIGDPLGAGWRFGGAGDVDGDGTDDLVFAKSGQVHYWKMKLGRRVSGANIHTPVSSGWRIGGVGDVDGDGTDDIVWRAANGQTHYWKMKNGSRVAGANISTPVSGDWSLRDVGDVDQDGTHDIVWQRDNGQVQYWRMKGGERVSAHNVYRPVSGSWRLVGVGNVGSRP